MKVIFLDFDGVLNSQASFIMETRKRLNKKKASKLCPVNETLCEVYCSNLQYILEKVPDANIVISSTWRSIFDLDWLKDKLTSYGVDSSKVIDKTPETFGRARGREIQMWLDDHKEVKEFVIIDDNHIGGDFEHEIVFTEWNVGLTLNHARKAVEILSGKKVDNLEFM